MWKVGQKVVKVKNHSINPNFTGTAKIGDIRTVAGWRGKWFTTFEEGADPDIFSNPAYWPDNFVPITERMDADTDELIRQFTVPETLDAPFVPQIKKPQTI